MEPETKIVQNKNTNNQKEQIHRGIYINNQRRKAKGGRIRSSSIDLKIQIFDGFAALHQSEVEWVEIRRYTKGKQNQKKKNEDRTKNKKKQQTKKQLKQKAKQQLQSEKNQNKKKYKEKVSDKVDDNLKSKMVDENRNELVQQRMKVEKVKIEKNEGVKKIEDQNKRINNQKQEIEQKMDEETTQMEATQIITQQQRVNEKPNEEEQEQSQQQKQIVVGEIIRETKIIYKEQPFVGLFSFRQKKKGKYKSKDEKKLNSIFQIFVSDNEFQVYPINKRLQVMIVDQPMAYEKQIMTYLTMNTQLKQDMSQNAKLKIIFETLENVYVLLKFSYWQNDWPFAKIVKIIGKVNTIDGQCSCILHQHGLNDFEHIESQTKLQEIKINPSKFHKQLKRMVFTIDPKTSVDLDDSLSVEKLQGVQAYEVGIHIADVTSYLDKIDRQQLLKRTTSVYLPHKVYHMLPENLMKVCSLNPNVQRLVFSIFVKMNKKGQIIGQSRLQKNIIKSRFKLAYDTFQQFLIGNMNYPTFNQLHQCTQEQYELLAEKLIHLGQIAISHRSKRILFDVFENRQVEFQLNQQNWPIDVSIEKRYTAKKIVQQFMIIGNVEAAKHLVHASPNNALVIHHPAPSEQSVSFFNEIFKQLGIKFTFQDSKQTQKQLLKVKQLENIDETLKEQCFFKARRSQQPANYKTYSDIVEGGFLKESKTIHFALGEEFYTHFTSPMRRMADIIVHQMLNSIVYSQSFTPILTNEIERINFGRTATKRLKRDLMEVYLCLMLMKRQKNKEFQVQGSVLSFGSQSLSLFLPLFDCSKEIMWRSELQIDKVYKDRKKQQTLRVYIHFDKKSAKKDIFWDVKKFESVKVIIGCTKDAPLKMKISLEVKTNKGLQFIHPSKDL